MWSWDQIPDWANIVREPKHSTGAISRRRRANVQRIPRASNKANEIDMLWWFLIG
ncbi:jg375, partial [Pararge aegeria aegeria]